VKDWFALALRIFGVVSIAYGFRDLLDALFLSLGYFNSLETNSKYYEIWGLIYIAIGAYLLRGAPLLLNFAYPDEPAEVADDDAP
jgi:hypothetical protein